MEKKIVLKKACLLFGEGKGSEKKFFEFLEGSDKYNSLYEPNWFMQHDFASGSSASTIIEKCLKSAYNVEYDLILCFIDLDDLINDYPNSYQKERQIIDKKMIDLSLDKKKILVMWQEKDLEDELSRIIGKKVKKRRVRQTLEKYKFKIINSDFMKNIFSYFD